MRYKKIDLELIVIADDTEAVVAGLNAALDRMEEEHPIFGGTIEAVDVEFRRAPGKSALGHTRAAAKTAAGALRLAGNKMTGAFRTII